MAVRNAKLGGTDFTGEQAKSVDFNDTNDKIIEIELQNAYQDLENSIIDVQKDIDNTTTYTASFEYKVVDKYSDSNGYNDTVASSTYCYYNNELFANICTVIDLNDCITQQCCTAGSFGTATKYCIVQPTSNGEDVYYYSNCIDINCYDAYQIIMETYTYGGNYSLICNYTPFISLNKSGSNYIKKKFIGSATKISNDCYCVKGKCFNYTSTGGTVDYINCSINSSNFNYFMFTCANDCCCKYACNLITTFSYDMNQLCVNKILQNAVDLIAVKVIDLAGNGDNITFEVKDGANSLGTTTANYSGEGTIALCCATCTPCVFICSGSSCLNQLCGHGIKYFHC